MLEKLSKLFRPQGYNLSSEIGQGGFGKVFKALHITTGQPVAIKVLTLSEDFDVAKNKRYIERFERETDLCSRLQHPAIVKLLDKGRINDDIVYIVFEYIDGQTLRQILSSENSLSPVESADIMSQVLDGLSHAHQKGVLHRDLKPSNIMLTRTDVKTHVKILDFGIGTLEQEAKHFDFKTLTLTQETLGTPAYCAPEQLRGEPCNASSDLYVWGLVFIECLTGEPAFGGDKLASIFHRQLSPINVRIPAMLADHPLSHLLRRVLTKNIRERTQDSIELYHSLTQLNCSNIAVSAPFVKNKNFSIPDELDQTIASGPSKTTTWLERRQISSLSVILTLNSVTQESLNSEIIDPLFQDLQASFSDIAIRYSGSHIGTLGDTQLFYFGYPTTREEDSRLCAKTALEIISAINTRNSILKTVHGITFSVRIGMHMGSVVSQKDSVPVGETPNIAFALAREAKPNQILGSYSMHEVLAHYVEFKPHEELMIGMGKKPLQTYDLQGEKRVDSLGFLRANSSNAMFFGRNKELNEIEKHLISIPNSGPKNRVLYVQGEAGIGKSRLVMEAISRKQWGRSVFQCLPEYKFNGLLPVINAIKNQYALFEDRPASKLKSLLTNYSGGLKKALPLICNWFGIKSDLDEYDHPQLNPKEQKQILFDVLIFILCTQESEDNTDQVFVFEDLHWADTTTLEFISILIKSARFLSAGIQVICTSRTPVHDHFPNTPMTQICLEKLEEESCEQFIYGLFNTTKVANSVLRTIIERTDGIPLFIEELVNMLVKRQHVHTINGTIEFVDQKPIDSLPVSLLGFLQQKLDTLSHAKETVQLASTVGREFNLNLLFGSSDKSEEQIISDINELLEHGLIYVQRHVAGDQYVFKHALVGDASYNSMTSERKIINHRRIAESLVENDSLIAMHWGAANQLDKAIKHGLQAAKSALKRSIAKDAQFEGQRVENWIEQLGIDTSVDTRLQLCKIMTSAYMESDGWASKKVLYYSSKTKELANQNASLEDASVALWWEILNGVVGAKNEIVNKATASISELSKQVSSVHKAALKCAQAFGVYSQGNPNSCSLATQLLELAIADYEDDTQLDHEHLNELYGFDIKVFSAALLGRLYGFTAQYDKAKSTVLEALAVARKLEQIPSIGIALMYCAEIFQQLQDKEKVLFFATELLEIATKHEQPIYENYGQMLFDWAKGKYDKEADTYQALYQEHSIFSLAQYQSYYAETYFNNAQYEIALDKVTSCIQLDSSVEHGFFLPHLYLLKAKILTKTNPSCEEITELLNSATEMAKQQGATSFLLDINNFKITR